MRPRVLHFLAILRDTVPDATRRYTQGGCWQLYGLLHAAWPQATPWYDHVNGHVITEIDGHWYDIHGRVRNHAATPMAQEPGIVRQAHRWSHTHG